VNLREPLNDMMPQARSPNPASAVDGGNAALFAFERARPDATDRHRWARHGAASKEHLMQR
jgi:hypothetical protein